MRSNNLVGRMAVAALCLFSMTSNVLADDTSTAAMPVLRVTINDPIVKYMKYSNGTMQLTDTDGSVIEMKAKFKTRGATAQSYLMKPSLNMKLRTDDYSASQDSMLLGIRSASKWILDAMAIDRICMRNRVAMDIWNEYSKLPYETNFGGRSGTAGKFVEVYINGSYRGIYCLSDHINRKLLNLKKYDDSLQVVRGVLYKSGTEDILPQNERSFLDDYTAAVVGYHNAWELKEPEDHECREAWEPLLDLHDNRTSYEDVKKYFDIDNLVDFQIHVMALAIEDNWGNKNHFFSIRNIQKDIDDADPTEAARRKCIVSPWDLDTSLGGNYKGDMYDGNYSDFKPANLSKNGGFYPFSVCQGQSEYKTKLRNRWTELVQTTLSPKSVNARLEAYRDLFINSGAWQRMGETGTQPKYVADLAREISLIEEWYAKRCQEIDEYLGTSAGISQYEASDDTKASPVYSLQGIRLSEPPAKGMYIQGGKIRMK